MEAMKTSVVVEERAGAGEGLGLGEGRGEGPHTPAHAHRERGEGTPTPAHSPRGTLSQEKREEGAPSPALPHGARGGEEEETRKEEEGGNGALTPALSQGEREQEGADAPGSPAEPADSAVVEHEQSDAEGAEVTEDAGVTEDAEGAEGADWRGRAESAEVRVAELGDRLGAVEAAAEDLRRMVSESERARQVDRELLIAGVVELEAARELVDAQVAEGATVLEAVSRVRERKPLLFAGRGGGGGVRATTLPAVEGGGDGSIVHVAEAARETGDRRLLLRYLRMRRGER